MKKVFFLTTFLFATLMMNAQTSIKQENMKEDGPMVEMQTNRGRIVLQLYNDTPLHRDNFLKLASKGFFDGLLFHRVIEKFMIQGGDPDSRKAKPGMMLGNGSLGYKIPAEFRDNRFHKRGALCAAREGDMVNPKKESSSSQFYIVQGQVWSEDDMNMMAKRFKKEFSPEQVKAYTTVGGAPHLDGDYTVFGEVVEGMEVVDKIASAPRDRNDRPLEDVRILSVKVLKK